MAIYVADLRSTSGWTERWKTTEGSLSIVADALRITKSGYTGLYMASFDAVDSDAGRDNAEVLAKVKFGVQTTAAVPMCGIGVRGAGANGAEDLYSCLLYDAGNDGADRRPYVAAWAGGSFSVLGSVTGQSNIVSTWYWLKLRVNSTSIKAKSWVDGTAEPAAWSIDVTDAGVSAAGWIGFIGLYEATDPYDLGYFAVATNGDTISSGGGGFFLGADF